MINFTLSQFQQGVLLGYFSFLISYSLMPYYNLLWEPLEARFTFKWFRTVTAILGIIAILTSIYLIETLKLLP